MKIYRPSEIISDCKKAFLQSLLNGSNHPLDKLSKTLSEHLQHLQDANDETMTPLEKSLCNRDPDLRSAQYILRDARTITRSNAINHEHLKRNPHRTPAINAIRCAQDVIPNLKISKVSYRPESTIKRAVQISLIFAVASYPMTLLTGTGSFTNEQIWITTAIGSGMAYQTFNNTRYKWLKWRGLKKINNRMNLQ